MHSELGLLVLTAITISCIHTFSGPDHYLPFVALSKSRGWSVSRTALWTMVCGIGHVGSSVVLGLIGIAVGFSLSKLTWLENIRGGYAAWALLLFGLVYTLWGLYHAKLNRPHKHFDINDDGSIYVFEHQHGEAVAPKDRYPVTPWVMFFIFAMGPSEPMIPLLSYPAAKNSVFAITALVIVYIIATVLTMVVMVVLSLYGISYFKTSKIERYVHALGGPYYIDMWLRDGVFGLVVDFCLLPHHRPSDITKRFIGSHKYLVFILHSKRLHIIRYMMFVGHN